MKFKVDDTFIVCTDPTLTVGDNKYSVEFEFDSTWDGLTKTARFVQNGAEYDIVLADDECEIDFLKKGILVVGVYAADKATITAKLKVEKSIVNGSYTADPVPSVYNQLITMIGNLDADVDAAKEAAETATTKAHEAETSATEAATSEANAKTSETNAAAYEASAQGYAATASSKADEASASATEAKGYRDEALTAKTGAETAKADTETIKGEVETLESDTATIKSETETIKTETEAIKTSMQSSLDQIETNKEDIADVKNDLTLYAMHVDTDGHLYINTEEE